MGGSLVATREVRFPALQLLRDRDEFAAAARDELYFLDGSSAKLASLPAHQEGESIGLP